ncbi:predicted protein, partial [Nematostella vectensis]
EHGYSSAHLLMSRHLRTTLPIVQDQLKASDINLHCFKEKDESIKLRQKNI